MDRILSAAATHRFVTLFVAIAAISIVGCKGILFPVAYLIQGNNVPAKYTGLVKKRVAVIVRPPSVSINSDQQAGANELAGAISRKLRNSVKDINIIDQPEVDEWTDNLQNNVDDYAQIGESLEADMVVVVEMEAFGLYDSTSVYRGRANYRLLVYDVKDGGRIAYDFEPQQESVYPPSVGIPIGNKRRSEFRRIYVDILADEVARHFYPHDTTVYFAQDSDSLKYH